MKLHNLVPNPGSKRIVNALDAAYRPGQGKTGWTRDQRQGSRSGEGGRLYRQGGKPPVLSRLPFIRGEGFTLRIK